MLVFSIDPKLLSIPPLPPISLRLDEVSINSISSSKSKLLDLNGRIVMLLMLALFLHDVPLSLSSSPILMKCVAVAAAVAAALVAFVSQISSTNRTLLLLLLLLLWLICCRIFGWLPLPPLLPLQQLPALSFFIILLRKLLA